MKRKTPEQIKERLLNMITLCPNGITRTGLVGRSHLYSASLDVFIKQLLREKKITQTKHDRCITYSIKEGLNNE